MKKDTPNGIVNATGHVRPLAKAENLPVDETGNAQAKTFEILCNRPIILENIDFAPVGVITSCMQE
jgi:hypothetical protein